MADFSGDEVIRGSELRADPVLADVKFLRGGFERLAQTSAQHSEMLESLAKAMCEIQRSVSKISNQLGQRQIEAESRQLAPSVLMADFDDSASSDQAVLNTEKFDSMEALLREMKQAPSFEMPEFDASNVSDWLSKVEQSFRVHRYSDLDKLNLVAFSLEGAVLNWFNWEMTRREFRSWDEFRRRLLLRFGAAPENRLLAIKQTGTVSAYVTELEEESIHQNQVPVASVEPSLSFSCESLVVSDARQSEIVDNNWVHSQSVLESVKNKATAYQVFDKTSPHKERLKSKPKRKLSLSPKTWMFKFKNKLLHRNKSTNRILAELNFDAVNASTSRSNKSSDPSSFVIRVRDYSKYGTVIKTDMGKEEKVHELLHQEKILKDGDVNDEKILSQYRPAMLIEEALLKVVTKPVTAGKTAGFKEVFMTLAAPVSQLNCFNLPLHHVPNNGLLVFPWNLLFLEFFLSIHLEDKVCLSGASNSWCGWMVFDRGKNIIISEDVITIKRDGQKMLLVKVKDAHVDSLVVSFKELWIEIMDGDIAKLLNSTSGKWQSYGYVRVVMFLRRLRVHHRQQKRKFTKAWKFKYKSRLKKIKLTDTSLRTIRFKSREMKQFVGFVKFQVKHKWRLVWRIWRLHNQVVATREVLLFTEMITLLIAVIEAYTKILDKLQLNFKQGLDVHGASGLRLFLRQQTFSSIWHRWRRKDWDLEVQMRKRDLMVAYSLRLPPGSTTHDSSENSWMFSKGFVSLFPTFKLEDKLVLQGESIDTITNRIIGRRTRT